MIGTAAALIGSAVIGAGASAISASKNSKAINKASTAEAQGNAQAIAAQEKARSENLALQTPIYNAGLPAIQARNALLGLGGTQSAPQPAQTLPTAQPNALAAYQGPYADSSALPRGVRMGIETIGGDTPQFAYEGMGGLPGYTATGMPQGATAAAPAGQSPAQAAGNAFDIFRNSTGYQFRLGEGMRAVNSGYAAAGTLQSGAALKAINKYGQDFASNEFANYMGYLGDQQNLAAGAANAMSGVNTNYANNAGNLAIANGQNIANAAVAKANNSNALIGSIGSGVGNVLGYYGGLR